MGMVISARSGTSEAAERLALLEPALQAAAQQAQQLGIGARDALALFDRLLTVRGLAAESPAEDTARAVAAPSVAVRATA
jgi:hypothetical protein